ncbi:C1 family peptidase [Pseudomonas tremae]|nr:MULTISPECIES: C1 family peptidase [Pseudomonas syringae group]KGS12211.1 peptidase C1 [Pseudomonas coronafaciens]KPB49753.1 Papain cysteine protease family protein [Pseudomonas coronafaciens pv. oryzae]MCF5715383.1 peptidase [Pseudomonas tremae]MCF5746956.1 peptidase [Pseudomonas tremae]MCQ3014240.1 C1 family peptidase [Pseudomonas tremae]
MTYTVKQYGWIRDLPDHRDHLYAAPVAALTTLPRSIDLRKHCPPVYDQGQLGSCTANGIAAAIQFDRMKQKLKPAFIPSRLFIYYNERVIEHSVSSDSGAMIRDGIKAVATLGDCPEKEWPYDIAKFAVKPPPACYKDAKKYKAVSYQKVAQHLNQMKGCLASGYPFVIGFSVYESFEKKKVAETGHAPMPAHDEKMLGGHCVLVVGYDDAHQRFLLRNSWGVSWGMEGYFTMPYGYLMDPNLSSDFWTIRIIAD